MPRCRPEAGPQEKASVGVRRVAIETRKVLRTAVSARPRVGSQARSKARDSRSLPAGVPRFESWPTHHQLVPSCGRVRFDRAWARGTLIRPGALDRQLTGAPANSNEFIKQ